MTTTEFEDQVIKSVKQMLADQSTPTTDTIWTAVNGTITMMSSFYKTVDISSIDRERIIKKIEALCNVYVPNILTLDDNRDHIEWFSSRRFEIQWRFWERYKLYLENDLEMPLQAVRQLDNVTDQIVSRLEDPGRSGLWDRRGMVVGQVQSGKTSNYTALICKAADAGYKLIIILAGVHNSLRSQTQHRLDESFLGFDTQRRRLYNPDNSRLGVGLIPGMELYRVHPLTSSHDTGDFNMRFARQANLMIGGDDPFLLVVKKNASVLKNLFDWCTELLPEEQDKTKRVVQRVPLLLIDDEADSASINTNSIKDENGNLDPERDPTKINGLIRKLLKSFGQSAYVAYTATPFANIYIPENESKVLGKDLFPASFIINLQPPSNYIGPTKLFGLVSDEEVTAGLPLIRQIKDYKSWVPEGHKKIYKPGTLPPSIHEALRAFILVCAVRYVRGKTRAHNSMLIHVTRFTDVQSFIYEQINEELKLLQDRLRYGDGASPYQLIEELRILWEQDFEPTSKQFSEPDITLATWEQIKEVLFKVSSKIEVRKINGTAKDTLQYVEHKNTGLSVICIGGDKLSRGLTLEGLSISYYLRPSKMYDTLMQMGRWFGYRDGYVDVCRLYITPEIQSWYQDITTSDEELRLMFEDMAAQDRTPQDYGLGVQTHPDGLLITTRSKMQTGRRLLLSYSQRITETVAFFADITTNIKNIEVTEIMIRNIDTHYRRNDAGSANYTWSGVQGEAIVDFLNSYQTHPTARTARSSMLSKYVKARIADRELTKWTVVLISIERNVQKDDYNHILATLPVGLIERDTTKDALNSRYSIGRLISPKDETIDFSLEKRAQALQETIQRYDKKPGRAKNKPEFPSGAVIRDMRSATQGLLLIYLLKSDLRNNENQPIPIVGLAISFPKSERGAQSAVEYMVNETYWQQMLEENDL